MAIGRKQALKKLKGIARRVEEHLRKLEATPDSQGTSHWKDEIATWLVQMEDMVPHVGKKTGYEWSRRIEEWKGKLQS